MLKKGSRKEFRHSPNMISNTSKHSWSLILVFFVFIHYFLSQTKMRFDEMVIGECEMELFLQSLAFLWKGDSLSNQAPIVMAHRQIVALNKAGIDMATYRWLLELGLDRFFGSKDYACANVNSMSALAMLHHLRIEQVLWGEQKWLTWPTGSARSRKLFFDAIRMHYGSIVMLQLIRGEEGNMPIRTVTDAR